MKSHFAHVTDWVFDLDHTLYPKETKLFDQIEVLMVKFMRKELGVSTDKANELRSKYWKQYGTTLAGLMAEHGMHPEPFLEDVHQISLDELRPDPALSDAIHALPGNKIIYTNGNKNHALRVIEARGLSDCFAAVFGVEHADYVPKPERRAFETVFEKAGIETSNAVMFEDDPRNLAVPFEMGMRTVLVDDVLHANHINFCTDNLTRFLLSTQVETR